MQCRQVVKVRATAVEIVCLIVLMRALECVHARVCCLLIAKSLAAPICCPHACGGFLILDHRLATILLMLLFMSVYSAYIFLPAHASMVCGLVASLFQSAGLGTQVEL